MPRLEELQLIRLQQESTPVKPPAGLKEHNSQKSSREKRKAGPSVEEESLAKRQKRKGQKVNEVDVEGQSATVPNTKNVKAENGKAADSNKEETEDAKPVKPKVYTDECTAFISNLSVKVSIWALCQLYKHVCDFLAQSNIVVGRYKRKIYASFLAMLVALIPFAFSITKTLENQGYLSHTHLMHVIL